MPSSAVSLSVIPLALVLFMISFPAFGRMTQTTSHKMTGFTKSNLPKAKRKESRLPVILPARLPGFFLLLERWRLKEEICLLLNYRMDSMNPMGLILSGQNALWYKLKMQRYAAIRQQIDIKCEIPQYERTQTEEYIQFHLRYADDAQDIYIYWQSGWQNLSILRWLYTCNQRGVHTWIDECGPTQQETDWRSYNPGSDCRRITIRDEAALRCGISQIFAWQNLRSVSVMARKQLMDRPREQQHPRDI